MSNNKLKIDISVNLEISYDIDTEEIAIINCVPTVINRQKLLDKEWHEHILNKTQAKFGLLSFGAKSFIGRLIPKQEKIIVRLIKENDEAEEKCVNTHKSIKGRVDGLSSIYANNPDLVEDSTILVRYLIDEKILEIKKKI